VEDASLKLKELTSWRNLRCRKDNVFVLHGKWYSDGVGFYWFLEPSVQKYIITGNLRFLMRDCYFLGCDATQSPR
jgi:hypothetical protein